MTLDRFIGNNTIMRLSTIMGCDNFNACTAERFICKDGNGRFILFEVGGYENQSEGLIDCGEFLSDKDYINKFTDHYPTLLEYTKFRNSKEDIFYIEDLRDVCEIEYNINGLDKHIGDYTILFRSDVLEALSKVNAYSMTDKDLIKFLDNEI